MRNDKQNKQFVICMENKGYGASLEKRKIYQLIPDKDAEKRHLFRVIDESGEDYLYPIDFFLLVDLPVEAAKAFLVTS